MDLQILDKKTDIEFSKLIDTSTSVRNWLINRLGGYNNIGQRVCTLHISIDSYTDPVIDDQTGIKYYSFNWCINAYETDPKYGDKISGGKHETIINGGLIYRKIEHVTTTDQWGNESSKLEAVYSSHT